MVAGVPEAVWRLGRHHEHLIRMQVDDVAAGRPAALAFEQDEGLRVRMHVEPDAPVRRRPHDEHRDADAGPRKPLEERGGGAEPHVVEIEDVHPVER